MPMKLLLCFIIALSLACLVSGVVIADFKDGQYRLDTSPLEQLKCALAVVVAVGDSRVGKSTTGNSIEKLAGQSSDFFLTHNRLQQCTTAVQVAPLLPGCILLVDRPGQNKAGVARGVDATMVDVMTTQLLAPFANTVLAFVDNMIMENDLQGLAMFGDEHLHLGAGGSAAFKPDLIIVLKRRDPIFLYDDKTPSTEQEYLDYEVGADSPLRKAFASISLVIMPDVPMPDRTHLSYENFHPELVPAYWNTIQRLNAMISASAARVPESARLTGTDLSSALHKILPGVNANTKTDVAGTRTALLLNKVKSAVLKQKADIDAFFAPYMADPFHANHNSQFVSVLSSRRSAAEKVVLDEYRAHEREEALWRQMQGVVTTEVGLIFSAVTNAFENRKGEILNREHTAQEQAREAMSAARTSMKFNGTPAQVNQELTTALREALKAFQAAAVIDKVTPSPSYAEKLQRLKDDAAMHWTSSHDANFAAYTTKRQELQAKASGAVTERIAHGVHTCSNTHHDHIFDLASRLPQYFGPQARVNLYSVKSRLEGSGEGEGAFNLNPGAGEHLVSTGGIGGRKYNGNRVYYNPGNAVLKVYLEGGGWGGGVCTNPLWMNGINLTITRNALALPENAVYNQPYNRGAAPAF